MAQNNPFADAFKSLNDQLPQADWGAWSSWNQQSWNAVSAANQAIAEGVQAVAKRCGEIAQKNAEDALDLFKEVASSKDPKEAAAKQADAAKKSFEQAAADANEILSLCSKSSSKAYEIVGKQMTESIKEWSKAAAPKQKKKAEAA